jgi:hypothetical protein
VHQELAAMKVIPELVCGPDKSKTFTLNRSIILLSWGHQPASIGHWILPVLIIKLGQVSTHSLFTPVHMQNERL